MPAVQANTPMTPGDSRAPPPPPPPPPPTRVHRKHLTTKLSNEYYYRGRITADTLDKILRGDRASYLRVVDISWLLHPKLIWVARSRHKGDI